MNLEPYPLLLSFHLYFIYHHSIRPIAQVVIQKDFSLHHIMPQGLPCNYLLSPDLTISSISFVMDRKAIRVTFAAMKRPAQASAAHLPSGRYIKQFEAVDN
jgi:hypothetical protein